MRGRRSPYEMFAELNELLGLSPERPERGTLTLLCASKTDASFLVHHFLSFYLKAGCKVCFVAVAQTFSHYSIVSQKLGASLTAAKERGQLVFLEGLKAANEVLFGEQTPLTGGPSPFQFISGDGSNLRALYEFVRSALSPPAATTAGATAGAAGDGPWKGLVLMVDDLSLLLSLGLALADVLDFIHYCRATVNAQLEGNVVAMVRTSEDSEDEENAVLTKALRHQSSRVLWAEGLATGYCKDVHGQLTIFHQSSQETRARKEIQGVYQYKLQDRNASFFARGTSAAVL